MAELVAQGAEGIVNDLGFVGAEEDQVAGLSAGAVNNHFQCIFMHVLDDRRLQAGFVELGNVIDFDISQAAGAVDADELGVLVDFAPCHAGAAWDAQGRNPAIFAVGDAGEDLESDVLDGIGHFSQLKRDAEVGLVRSETAHRLAVRHAWERVGQVDVDRILEDVADQFFDQAGDVVLGHEGGFDIDLGEFGLTVGAQVFVAEAFD
ncbi:MAG: hypothetical protein ACD_10C00221G0001, partial [uncultured bacterium]